jgi:hypothetical protein
MIAPMIAGYWWIFIALFAIVIVGLVIGAFVFERRRAEDVEHDPQRPGPRRPEDFPER